MRKKKEMSTEPTITSSKKELLNSVISELNRGQTKPVIMIGSDSRLERGVLSTGNIAIDAATGGGLVKGLSVEIRGSAGSGKTSLAVSILKQSQLDSPNAVQMYFASENDVPTEYFQQAEIDLDSLLVVHPTENAEASLDVILDGIRRVRNRGYQISLVIIDSVAALSPAAEVNKAEDQGIGKDTVGLQAKLMSKLHRVISGSGVLSEGTILVLINQERSQIGVVPLPNTTPGGHASGYFCKTILRLTAPKSEQIKKKDTTFLIDVDPSIEEILSDSQPDSIVGHTVMVEVMKLNTGRGKPHKKTSYRVIYGYGIDEYTPIMENALALGIIVAGGPYYSYNDVKIQGKSGMAKYLSENNLWDTLKEQVTGSIKSIGKKYDDLSDEEIVSEELVNGEFPIDNETGEILEENEQLEGNI